MQEMQEAGFRNIGIRSVTKAFPVGTTAEFWDHMVKGSAPIRMLKKAWAKTRGGKKKSLRSTTSKQSSPQRLPRITSDAWLGLGIK